MEAGPNNHMDKNSQWVGQWFWANAGFPVENLPPRSPAAGAPAAVHGAEEVGVRPPPRCRDPWGRGGAPFRPSILLSPNHMEGPAGAPSNGAMEG